MTRGWWRRNAIALGAIAVLLPVTGAVIAGNEWWGWNQARPVFATFAERGDEVAFADATWGPATADVAASTPDDVPPGTTMLIVDVPVDPGEDGIACGRPILRELSGAQRQWNDATGRIDWDYELPTSCDSEAAGPFVISVPFLLPDDARGPFAVDVEVADELPGFLRLVVVP